MPTTSHFGLRYPSLTDTPDGATQIGNLASDTDTALYNAIAGLTVAAYKGADELVTSSTVLQNDNDLVVAVAASTIYQFSCYLYFTCVSGGSIQWTWQGPSGAFLRYDALHNEGGTTGLQNSAQNNGLTSVLQAVGAGTGAGEAIVMYGTLRMATTPGNLQLQWAQLASSGTAAVMKQDSHLVLRKIG